MSYAQYLEEIEYSQSAQFDRFDGFDRGDAGAHHEYGDDDYEEMERMAAEGEAFEASFVGPRLPELVGPHDMRDFDIPF